MSRKITLVMTIAALVVSMAYFNTRANSAQPADTYQAYLPLVSWVESPAWVGPEGGKIVVVSAAPSDPQVVFAGTWGAGVFKSQDGGASWRHAKTGLDNLLINSMAVDPTNAMVVYAGTYKSGIYKSVDQGETWQPINTGLLYPNTIVYTIAVNPLDPQNLYMGTRSSDGSGVPPWRGVVYRSIDGGDHWAASLQNIGGAGAQDWVYALSILPASPNIVLAASHEHGPYRSSDYGLNWQPVSSGISDGSGRGVVFDPSSPAPGTAYYGTWHLGGIFKTTNGGNTWRYNGGSGLKIYTMAIDPSTPTHVYAAIPRDGVLKTADAGGTWQLVGLATEEVSTVAVNPANSNILYTATFNGGIFTSFDQGATWVPTNHNLLMASATTLLVKPGDSNRLYMSTFGDGVAYSSDRGKTWAPLNTGLGDLFVHSLLMDPAQPNILFALTDSAGLYRIDISGSGGWQSVAKNLPVFAGVRPLAGLPAAVPFPEVVDEISPRAESLPAGATLLAGSFALSSPTVIYLGLAGGGVYRSIDSGANWYPMALGAQTVWSLAISPVDANQVYAATDTAGSLKLSTDGGASWTDLPLPGVTFYGLSISPLAPGTLYAATSDGVYTYNGGWASLGLAGQAIIAVAAHPTRPGLIFAGTADGALISLDGGQSWLPGPLDLDDYRVQGIHFDPNNPRVIYFDTDSGGSLRFLMP